MHLWLLRTAGPLCRGNARGVAGVRGSAGGTVLRVVRIYVRTATQRRQMRPLKGVSPPTGMVRSWCLHRATCSACTATRNTSALHVRRPSLHAVLCRRTPSANARTAGAWCELHEPSIGRPDGRIADCIFPPCEPPGPVPVYCLLHTEHPVSNATGVPCGCKSSSRGAEVALLQYLGTGTSISQKSIAPSGISVRNVTSSQLLPPSSY